MNKDLEIAALPDLAPSLESARKSQTMAWAKDGMTGQLMFIGQLPRSKTGLKCDCFCYGCGAQVEAVNAGLPDAAITPHFRHSELRPGLTCSKELALELMSSQLAGLEGAVLDIPARKVTVSLKGLSGKEYATHEELPAERHTVAAVELTSHAQGVVTLDDGRQILVSLDGNFNSHERGLPTIVVHTDDPAIARMSADELRQRITVLIGAGQWHGPLLDESLEEERLKQLALEAMEALDFVPEEAVAEIGRTPEPETLLHWTAKELLKEIPRIAVPPIRVRYLESYSRRGVQPPDCQIPGTTLDLSDIRLEARLGETRPDVQAMATSSPSEIWDGPLAIEIAVSNKVTPERAQRIAEEGVASLEIDLSRLDRVISRTRLKRILEEDVPQKDWVFHPYVAVLTEKVLVLLQAAAASSQPKTGALKAKSSRELATEFEELFLEVYQHTHGRTEALHIYSEEYHLAMVQLLRVGKQIGGPGFPPSHIVGNPHLSSILKRIYSLKRDEPEGSPYGSAVTVLKTMLEEPRVRVQGGYHYLYLAAIKAYRPRFQGFPEAQERIEEWREKVHESMKDPGSPFFPIYEYNKELLPLLPDMVKALQWRLPESLYLRISNALANVSHPYQQKDLEKAKLANKFIGQGSPNSLTNRYRVAAGNYANTGVYKATDVVFVSAEGAGPECISPDMDELKRAIDIGVTFVTDNPADRQRPFNEGERDVAAFLQKNGYVDLANNGRWTPRRNPTQRSFTES